MGRRGGNLNSASLSAACLTMRVTWCSNPCNLRNRGGKKRPCKPWREPWKLKLSGTTNWSLFLVLLFSCGRFKLNCFFFLACTGQKKNEIKINGQSGAHTPEAGRFDCAQASVVCKSYFLLIYDSATGSNIYPIDRRKYKRAYITENVTAY